MTYPPTKKPDTFAGVIRCDRTLHDAFNPVLDKGKQNIMNSFRDAAGIFNWTHKGTPDKGNHPVCLK